MTGHGEKLSRKQESAIASLLSHSSVEAAARACGVGERTLRRWLSTAAFVTAYDAARRAVLDRAIGGLTGATGQALDALKRNLDCGNPSAEVRAAVAVFDLTLRATELRDVLARLDDLEALTGGDDA